MSENSSPSAFSPFNSEGNEPQQVAYRWGLTAKAYKGANVDITYGVKSSTVVGLSNSNVLGFGAISNYTPLYNSNVLGLSISTVTGWRKTFIVGSDSQYIKFNQTKTLLGTEIKHNGGNKYEFFDTNAYKFIGGKEYKVEAKAANPVAGSGASVSMPELQAGQGICTFVPYQDDFHSQFKNYSDQAAWVAKNKIEHKSAGTLALGAVGKMTVDAGSLVTTVTGALTETVAGNITISGQKADISGKSGASLVAGPSGVKVALNKVTIGLQVDLGVPTGQPVNLNVALSTLQQELAQAIAAANTAQQSANLAAQGALTALQGLASAGI